VKYRKKGSKRPFGVVFAKSHQNEEAIARGRKKSRGRLLSRKGRKKGVVNGVSRERVGTCNERVDSLRWNYLKKQRTRRKEKMGRDLGRI